VAPINQGSLRWVSVYGHVMAGTFVLLVLADLSRIAGGDRAPTSWQLGRWTLLLVGAATSFGTGLGVALAFPAIAWLLLPPACGRDRGALVLVAGTAAIAALFLVQYQGLPLGGLNYPLVRRAVGELGLWPASLALVHLHVNEHTFVGEVARPRRSPLFRHPRFAWPCSPREPGFPRAARAKAVDGGRPFAARLRRDCAGRAGFMVLLNLTCAS
jgi:hypothetical protein